MAAAVRYQSEAKNPAYAPTEPRAEPLARRDGSLTAGAPAQPPRAFQHAICAPQNCTANRSPATPSDDGAACHPRDIFYLLQDDADWAITDPS